MADIVDNTEVDKDTIDKKQLDEEFSKKYTLLSETAVSLHKSYINKLSVGKSLKLAVTLQNHNIEVYELSNTSIKRICRLSGHEKGLSGVVFDPKDDNLVFSSGYDGVVKLWDTRTNGLCVLEYTDKEQTEKRLYECLDVSCDARVICAGTQLVGPDAYLVFWDKRQYEPLGGYWESHTDEITQVKFHKEKKGILASGSLDGLINTYNINEISEDDALLYSLNVENSVDKLSWLDEKDIACVTQSNDVQIWDTESGDMLRSYSRSKIAKGIRRSREDDCYVVDAFRPTNGDTVILAGSNGGDGNVLRSATVSNKKLLPYSMFKGNKQMVRCSWYHNEKELLVTAGEGGLISVWGVDDSPHDAPNGEKTPGAIRNKPKRRQKPY